MKKILFILTATAVLFGLVSCTKKDTIKSVENKISVVASTSWTAAFADLAGVDEVEIIAPATLRHPPEYEITVSDIQKINDCNYFVFAGFERMMKTLGDSVGSAEMIKIQCDNSIETATKMSQKISAIIGTEGAAEKRLADYIDVINKGAKKVESKGLKGRKVLCNKNQIYLAKDLGFEYDVFGPGEVTSDQIAMAKSGDYAFIIDNVHNPVGAPLAEVAPEVKYVIWRNFPEKTGRNALLNVVKENIDSLGL